MTADAPVLVVEGVSKEFFGVRVLRDVSLSLAPGRVLGLVGENGAGKSTLMNILGGILVPDGGSMRLDGEPYRPRGPRDAAALGVTFIHQELNVFSNLSITDNLFLTSYPRLRPLPLLARRTSRERARQLLREVGLDRSPDDLVETLAPGERQLVEIAKAISTDAKVVIFDEPTTSLTARETEKLFDLLRRLQARGTAIVYISHILADVRRVADEILVLRDGGLVGSGPVAEFPTDRMISLMVGRALEQLYPDRRAVPGDGVVLDVAHLSQPGVVADVSLQVHEGEVVGLFGLMGAGRTELARMVFGLDPYASGSVAVDGHRVPPLDPRAAIRRGAAFVTEDRRDEGLLMDFPVVDNLAMVALPRFGRGPAGVVDTRALVAAAREVGKSLRLKTASLERQPARSLSGGNQQKIVLGKWLLSQPRLFILDEPTRGVDVGAKYEVYTVVDDLAARGAGVLVISSELDELQGICDRILVLRRGEITGGFERGAFDAERILRAAFGEPARRASAQDVAEETT
jgi:ABC-type sugar transport system ATPase subunit